MEDTTKAVKETVVIAALRALTPNWERGSLLCNEFMAVQQLENCKALIPEIQETKLRALNHMKALNHTVKGTRNNQPTTS